MALSLLHSVALRPASQHALAPKPQRLPENENAQYQGVLAVAFSQEQRLRQHGAIRKKLGYDLQDPFLVATSESDFGTSFSP